MRKLALHWQILIAIVLQSSLARLSKPQPRRILPHIFGVPVTIFDYIGEIFLNGLR